MKYGVKYAENDYAGFWRRLVTQLIDIFVVVGFLMVGLLIDGYRYDPYHSDQYLFITYVFLVAAVFYLTVVKSSSVGTLGQIFTKTKVIDLNGERPGFFRMLYRLLFWLFGPFNAFVDVIFMTTNVEKRTVRDCLCNTLVVKRSATPVTSESKIRHVRIMFCGWHFVYMSANDY